MPNSSQLRSRVSTWTRESSSAIRRAAIVPSVGRVVVGGGQGLVGAADRAAGQAQAVEGLRRGDLVDQVQVDVDQPVGDLVRLPDLVEHRSSALAQLLLSPAAITARNRVGSSPSFSKWCGRSASKVTLSPSRKLVAAAVDDQRQGAGEDDGGLAAAGLVHRRVRAAAGGGAGLEHVQGDVGALAGQRRGQLLEAVPAALGAAAAAGAADRDVLALVEAQQLRERQLQAGGDLRRRRPGSGSSPRARPARASAR